MLQKKSRRSNIIWVGGNEKVSAWEILQRVRGRGRLQLLSGASFGQNNILPHERHTNLCALIGSTTLIYHTHKLIFEIKLQVALNFHLPHLLQIDLPNLHPSFLCGPVDCHNLKFLKHAMLLSPLMTDDHSNMASLIYSRVSFRIQKQQSSRWLRTWQFQHGGTKWPGSWGQVWCPYCGV